MSQKSTDTSACIDIQNVKKKKKGKSRELVVGKDG